MTQHLHNQSDLECALGALADQDPRLKPIIALTGMPVLRRREPGFAGLASTICGQQLSTSAAAAIWSRLTAAFDPFHHDRIRYARPDRLGRLGLSAAKIKTLKFVAAEIGRGGLDLTRLAEAPADDAHAALIALHGIGPWTADIYLLFCLGHGDAWPAGDLALQEAIRIGFGLKTRPTVREMAAIGDDWRPWRGAAAHLFWAYYKIAKAPGFEAAPPINATNAGGRKTHPTTVRGTKQAGRKARKARTETLSGRTKPKRKARR